MRERPSRTAYRVALSRAAHQLLDQPRLMDDPLAPAIVGVRGVGEIRAHPLRFHSRFARYLRAFVVARSRAAQEALATAVARGVRQYVVLGAGLETLAYQLPHSAAQLRIFEVDHPATQSWKGELLREARIAVPPAVSFVPVDFERESLAERLQGAGLRADVPAFFSWLGVSMYLTHTGVTDTLRYIASFPHPSGVLFDYAVPPASLDLGRRLVIGVLMSGLAAGGEPWKSFFDPSSLREELTVLGFRELEDLGPQELNARYFEARPDGLRVGGLGRLMYART